MKSPKAQAEEETRRGLGREAWEAERAGGEGEATCAQSRRKETQGQRDKGEGSSVPLEAKGRGAAGVGLARRGAQGPSLPQRRGVQGILPASLRPAAGPARRVTKSSGG